MKPKLTELTMASNRIRPYVRYEYTAFHPDWGMEATTVYYNGIPAIICTPVATHFLLRPWW